MPITYGLSDQGFTPKTLQVLEDEAIARIREKFGPTLPVDGDTIEGTVMSIGNEQLAMVWEVLEHVYKSRDPDANTGQAQDATAAITGTFRRPAKASAVDLIWTGDDGTVVDLARRASATGTGAVAFSTNEGGVVDGVMSLADVWGASDPYSVGAIVSNASKIYVCIEAGVSAGSGGPSTTGEDITDGSVHWRYVGDGLAYVELEAQALEEGPYEAPAFTLTEIVTPIAGVQSVNNLLDAAIGSNVMSNEALRVLREAELARPGTGTVPAIRAALLELADVTAATVFYNNTDTTDGDGLPPHSIEAMVEGGDDDIIRQTLFENVAAGILTHGTEVGTVTDSQGTAHTFKFSRPTEKPIYIAMTVTYDADAYPEDGDDQIKSAIALWGQTLPAGRDAVARALGSRAFDIDGVLDTPVVNIGLTPGPVASTTLVITTRERATYDTGRITVTSSAGTP